MAKHTATSVWRGAALYGNCRKVEGCRRDIIEKVMTIVHDQGSYRAAMRIVYEFILAKRQVVCPLLIAILED